MPEIIKDAAKGTPIYMYILIIFSIGLLIGAFLCPPVGIIDVSVYRSVAILFGGVVALRMVDQLPLFVEKGAEIRAKASHEGVSLEINKKDNIEVNL